MKNLAENKDVLKRRCFFSSNYDLEICNDSEHLKSTKSTPNRICRFCNNDSSKVKFQHIAHAVPQFIGNGNIILEDECDECNDFFGKKLESNFASYLGPDRTFQQIPGKKGIPTYRT